MVSAQQPRRRYQNLIVLCTGNICRSPMAEVLLDAALDNVSVASAGVGALVGHSADAIAMRLMAARGYDLTRHRARAFDGAMGLQNDLILTMSQAQRHHVERRWPLLQGRVFTLGYHDDSDIDDPYRRGESAFRRALEDIEKGVDAWTGYLPQ